MQEPDVVIVGAGLAGLTAAYHLAESGISTVVLEHGDNPGAKTLTGGRIYVDPVKPSLAIAYYAPLNFASLFSLNALTPS